ncbi:MAG: lipid-A-disaccharide synthase [Verrucomicrobiota bacterium]
MPKVPQALNVFLVAGEPSGDQLGAELVTALRRQAAGDGRGIRCYGAGGERLAAAGMELAVDLTRHSVIGLWEVLRRYGRFRRLFQELLQLALEGRPEVVVGIDFGGFNLRFARAIRRHSAGTGWTPRVVQFVSPQVWASRPGRARRLARNHDLVLSILPFEKAWYARHAPGLRVEFVGHPLVDRHARPPAASTAPPPAGPLPGPPPLPRVVLLPGSRPGELARHLGPMLGAAERIGRAHPGTEFPLVLPTEALAAQARSLHPLPRGVRLQVGGLDAALDGAALALASTGTVTLECAWFRVPTLALYRTSWSTYEIGRRLITVKHLAMPNLLAGGELMPEFIQHAATPDALAGAALALLRDPGRAGRIRERLGEVARQLGEPGAADRAARAILDLAPPA